VIEKFNGEALQQHQATYASEIGGIGWAAMCTRPDLAHSYTKLARYVNNPSPNHFKALQLLFGYIKVTLKHKLTYTTTGSELEQPLMAYSDRDFAGMDRGSEFECELNQDTSPIAMDTCGICNVVLCDEY
jgi:hypothetical protein